MFATPLSVIVHRDHAYATGRRMAGKLKDIIPRQQFEIPRSGCDRGKVIAPRNGKGCGAKMFLSSAQADDITRKKKLPREAKVKAKKRIA